METVSEKEQDNYIRKTGKGVIMKQSTGSTGRDGYITCMQGSLYFCNDFLNIVYQIRQPIILQTF